MHRRSAFSCCASHACCPLPQVLLLLTTKASSPACTNSRGETALTLCARNGHLDVAISLLKLGLNVDCRANDGTTPLFAAVEFNQEETAAFLIELKVRGFTSLSSPMLTWPCVREQANVNAIDNERNSILHVAANNGFADLVYMLLKGPCSSGAGCPFDCLTVWVCSGCLDQCAERSR